MADRINIGQGAFTVGDVVAAATTDLTLVPNLRVRITSGSGPITSFGAGTNKMKFVTVGADVTIAHGASLLIPGSKDIDAKTGDTFIAVSGSIAGWTIYDYMRKTGRAMRDAIWGDPIASSLSISGVAVVDFTGLSEYRELKIVAVGLRHGTVANQAYTLRFSDDASSWTYDATGYVNVNSSGTTSIILATPVPTTTDWDFEATIYDFNNASYKTRANTFFGRIGASPVGTGMGRYNTPRVNTALRITNGDNINFTAGDIYLYGRKG